MLRFFFLLYSSTCLCSTCDRLPHTYTWEEIKQWWEGRKEEATTRPKEIYEEQTEPTVPAEDSGPGAAGPGALEEELQEQPQEETSTASGWDTFEKFEEPAELEEERKEEPAEDEPAIEDAVQSKELPMEEGGSPAEAAEADLPAEIFIGGVKYVPAEVVIEDWEVAAQSPTMQVRPPDARHSLPFAPLCSALSPIVTIGPCRLQMVEKMEAVMLGSIETLRKVRSERLCTVHRAHGTGHTALAEPPSIENHSEPLGSLFGCRGSTEMLALLWRRSLRSAAAAAAAAG